MRMQLRHRCTRKASPIQILSHSRPLLFSLFQVPRSNSRSGNRSKALGGQGQRATAAASCPRR
jgi:hypothetical protein